MESQRKKNKTKQFFYAQAKKKVYVEPHEMIGMYIMELLHDLPNTGFILACHRCCIILMLRSSKNDALP